MSTLEPGAAAREDRADVLAYLAGERGALDRLVWRHKDRVFNLCYRLTGDYREAEECAQETFVKVLRSLGGFRLDSSFSTWLYTIAVNTCKNRRGSAEYRFWKRVLSFGRNPAEDDGPEEFEVADDAPSALALLAEKEREQLVQAAIDSLPHDYRTVIVLRHIEELSYDEIAEITGYNIGTLKSKLARARLLLQKKLQGA